MPEFPARTPDEIAALTDGVYRAQRKDMTRLKLNGAWFNFMGPALTDERVASKGGITARLADPAPLEALLRRWAKDHGCYCDVEEDESCLTCQTEAALNTAAHSMPPIEPKTRLCHRCGTRFPMPAVLRTTGRDGSTFCSAECQSGRALNPKGQNNEA